MKKLTKRVLAGGLWFDVNEDIKFITFDEDGEVSTHISQPKSGEGCWLDRWENLEIAVDLEGADWRECRWYIGDQVDGEAVERRDLMARGVELSIDKIQSMFDDSYINSELKLLLLEVRGGEVE